MASLAQPPAQQSTQTPAQAPTPHVASPPMPPNSQVIVVPTTSPLLIPDEDKTAYCFNRRNIFDIVIGLIIAIGVIYFVMQNNANRYAYGLEDFGSGITDMFSSSNVAQVPQAIPKQVTASGLGGQLGGFIKRLFK